jgi:molecular chaperone HtpG
MIDPIDDFVIPQLMEYKGKKLKAVNKGDIEEDKEKLKDEEKVFEGYIGYAKDLLDGIKEVKLTSRLKDSAAVLVGDEYSMSPHIEEMMRRMGQDVPPRESVLELNPEHPVVKKVQALYDANAEDPKVGSLTQLLHDQAVIASGAKLSDPAGFAARMNAFLAD